MTDLTSVQKQVLNALSKSTLRKKFYWSGGTALSAVYLHHRKSQDLDFFSDQPFSYNLIIGFINNLKKTTGAKIVEEKKIFDRWNFFIHNHEEIRLEFVYYDHPKLDERKIYNGIMVDSFTDIAANKLITLFDRNEPKDVIDLFYILTKGKYEIKSLIKFVQKKFGVKVEESSVWSQSQKSIRDVYQLKPLLISGESPRDIEQFFKEKSKKYLDRVLS